MTAIRQQTTPKSSLVLAPMRTSLLQRKCACGNHTMAGGECSECSKKKQTLQHASFSPRERGTEGEGEVPPIVHEVLHTPGQPLDPSTRAFMEPRFGQDFSKVRIHTDAKAAESNRAVNAHAFTVGNQVVFAAGRYQPHMTEGKRLLAHELTHVVQQAPAHSFGKLGTIPGQARPILQRQAGWSDAQGWNKQTATVYQSGTTTAPATGVPSVSRIPLEGLKEGNQDPSMTKIVTETQVDPVTKKPVPVIDPTTGKPKKIPVPVATKEKAAGKAIVIVPDALDPAKPVEILLHLHGYNEGYRQVGTSVRDIDTDRIEQQMIASGHTQLIAILPQGTTTSGFGASGLKSDPYIDQVLGRIAAAKAWSNVPTVAKGVEQVALSAHSGGGNRIQEVLSGTAGALPGKMRELVLFEAINGDGELVAVKQWTTVQIQNDVNQLKAAGSKDKQNKYLATSMRFRGYYTPKGSYAVRYKVLDKHIQDQFQKIVDPASLDADVAQTLKDHYKVIVTTNPKTGHENVLGEGGQLQDALGILPALPQPTTSGAGPTPGASGSGGPSSATTNTPDAGTSDSAPDAGTGGKIRDAGVEDIHGVPLQPKLMIGEAHNAWEQEADRMAETVLRIPGPGGTLPHNQDADLTASFPAVRMHREPAMSVQALQRQPNPATLPPQQLDPIRADEQNISFSSFNFKQLTIFVPKAVSLGFQDEITDLKVHVFFAAAGVQGNQANDVLTHGLRGSENSMWVLIAAPGVPGGAFLLSDQDIRDCLNAVGITTPIRQLRLSGHSRGGDSLVASIVQKKITTLSLIDHIFILDAASVQGGKVDRVPQLVSMGIPASKITAYEVNVHAGTRTKGATFVDLAPGCMAAIGYVRLIQDSIVTKPGVAALVNANPDITSQLASLPLPPRGEFASGTPTAKQTGIQGFCKQHASAISTILSNESKSGKGLLHFINSNNLVRFGTFQFSRGISAIISSWLRSLTN